MAYEINLFPTSKKKNLKKVKCIIYFLNTSNIYLLLIYFIYILICTAYRQQLTLTSIKKVNKVLLTTDMSFQFWSSENILDSSNPLENIHTSQTPSAHLVLKLPAVWVNSILLDLTVSPSSLFLSSVFKNSSVLANLSPALYIQKCMERELT